MTKTIIAIGVIVGSTIGGYVPALWGADIFSISSIFFSFLGGILGVWLGYRFSRNYL
jgi:hypothetical protein